MSNDLTRLARAAEWYAEKKGWQVFPLHTITADGCSCRNKECDRQGKHPRTEHGLHDASTDIVDIARWWRTWPDANIGIRTGSASGLVVLDVDVKDDRDGAQALETLEEEHGKLPDTVEAITGSGGRHLLFRHPGDREIKNRNDMLPGLDVRADGGYIVAAPSLHLSGRAYEYEASSGPRDIEVAALPEWLLKEIVGTNGNGHGNARAEPVPIVIAKGGRNATLASLAGTMRRRSATEAEILAFLEVANRDRCSPPLPDTEVSKIAWSVSRYPVGDSGPHATGPVVNSPDPKQFETDQVGVTLADFRAYMPEHKYIFTPARELWPAASVNARLGTVGEGDDVVKANLWLDQNQAVEQMTWMPGESMLIRDRLISHGGWIERKGVTCFNLYKPPTITLGDAAEAGRWIEHVHRVYPAEAEHIIAWLAHRVQRPAEKVNHALLLQGAQGTGKDTIIQGVINAVGPWNCQEVSPAQLLGRFNGFLKSVILRMSEARDLGEADRYKLYDHLKSYTAAPPDVLRVDEKNLREYAIPNVCGVVITTNYVDGVYLPVDDRRHFVAWTELTKDDFTPEYWTGIYRWYEHEDGYRHVAAYLTEYDLTTFDPKAPPPKTAAFWNVVDAGRAPEDAELADALDKLAQPDAVTLSMIAKYADASFGEWILDRRNARQIPHRMESVAYVSVRNDSAKDGRWKVAGRRQTVYARRDLSVRERITAAAALVERNR